MRLILDIWRYIHKWSISLNICIDDSSYFIQYQAAIFTVDNFSFDKHPIFVFVINNHTQVVHAHKHTHPYTHMKADADADSDTDIERELDIWIGIENNRQKQGK